MLRQLPDSRFSLQPVRRHRRRQQPDLLSLRQQPSASSGHFVVNGTTWPLRPPTDHGRATRADHLRRGRQGYSQTICCHCLRRPSHVGRGLRIPCQRCTNRAPVLTVPSTNVAATAGQSMQLSSLFSATDADGDASPTISMATRQARAAATSWSTAPVAGRDLYKVTAAQLAQTTFVAGAAGTSDDLFVMVTTARPCRGITRFMSRCTQPRTGAVGALGQRAATAGQRCRSPACSAPPMPTAMH